MENKPFITCKYDRAFKEIFLKEDNKDLLIELLKTCLEYKIEDVNILNSEVVEGNVNVKRKILDVLLENRNERINVEINTNTDKYVIERNIAYLCNVHSHNVLRGESYISNKRSIQINLSYGVKEDYIVKRCKLMDDATNEVLSDNLVLYVFNMDKILDIWYSKDEKLIKKYKYLIMLNLNEKELKKLALKDEKVGKYTMELNKVNVSVGINDWISEEEDKRRWKNTYIEEGYQEGMAKGMKDGLEKGLKQGIEQGVEKGIEQGIEQSLKIVASNLFKQGMSKELIASVCNVSIEKIDTILEGKRE